MRRTRRRRLIGVLVATVLVLAVAAPAGAAVQSGAPSAVSVKKKPKPTTTTKAKAVVSTCRLLTVAEITQALGTAPTEPPKADAIDECDYSAPGYYNFLNLSVSTFSVPLLWQRSVQGAGATIPVAGIGDEAFRSATNGTFMVRKGKKTLRIDQYVPGLDEAVIENLGKAATARL